MERFYLNQIHLTLRIHIPRQLVPVISRLNEGTLLILIVDDWPGSGSNYYHLLPHYQHRLTIISRSSPLQRHLLNWTTAIPHALIRLQLQLT